jgi:hypothetical protein
VAYPPHKLDKKMLMNAEIQHIFLSNLLGSEQIQIEVTYEIVKGDIKC